MTCRPGCTFSSVDGHTLCYEGMTCLGSRIPSPPEESPPGAVEKIDGRIAELRAIHANYLRYQQDRVNERDHHGAWDVAINLSETECEIAGLEFALKAIADEKGTE